MISAPVSISESGLPSVEYYAPNYVVEVDGRELDSATKGDVLQVKITMEIGSLTSFNLTCNNWDDATLFFKYSDTDTFDVGRRIHIKLGYADRLVSMVRGMVTALSPAFPQSGSPTIGITGHDAMFCLKDSKPKEGETRKYTNVADWQIAQAVATRNGMSTVVTQEGPVIDLIVQDNKDDAVFLLDRARRIDFDVFVQTDPDSGQDVLHFEKPTDGRDGRPIKEYTFEWGKTLMSFTPKLSLSGQVSKLTVRGWNPQTKEAISATASKDDLPAGDTNGTSGPAAIEKCLGGSGGKEERTVDAPVTSEEEAKALAVSLLTNRAYEFMTGNGQVIGLPDLRPGTNVMLTGLGQRFSGRYYVKKVEHTLGGSGFLTNFEVRKFVDGGTT